MQNNLKTLTKSLGNITLEDINNFDGHIIDYNFFDHRHELNFYLGNHNKFPLVSHQYFRDIECIFKNYTGMNENYRNQIKKLLDEEYFDIDKFIKLTKLFFKPRFQKNISSKNTIVKFLYNLNYNTFNIYKKINFNKDVLEIVSFENPLINIISQQVNIVDIPDYLKETEKYKTIFEFIKTQDLKFLYTSSLRDYYFEDYEKEKITPKLYEETINQLEKYNIEYDFIVYKDLFK